MHRVDIRLTGTELLEVCIATSKCHKAATQRGVKLRNAMSAPVVGRFLVRNLSELQIDVAKKAPLRL